MLGCAKAIRHSLAKLLGKIERAHISRRAAPDFPPVFIVGAPRTGSTLVYQYLTSCLDVAYINNFMCQWHECIALAAIVSRHVLHLRRHAGFESDAGRTRGWNGPSECGRLWYRWFPRDRHYVDAGELTSFQEEEIRNTVSAITRAFRAPLVVKNMNCGQRLRVLREIFPNALFIHCRRDPLFTAQSIIEAREAIHGSRELWWSVMPKEYPDLVNLGVPAQVVQQIYYIDREITTVLQTLPEGQARVVAYEDFCEYPGAIVDMLQAFMCQGGSPAELVRGIPSQPLLSSNAKRLEPELLDDIAQEIARLTW